MLCVVCTLVLYCTSYFVRTGLCLATNGSDELEKGEWMKRAMSVAVAVAVGSITGVAIRFTAAGRVCFVLDWTGCWMVGWVVD